MLALEDLKGLTEEQVKDHIVADYSGAKQYDSPAPDQLLSTKNQLEVLDVLIAYESVGDWGCDSSSFFLFKNKETGVLYELNGSHCSCYGFEGQFQLEQTEAVALKYRAENGRLFYEGGYDNNADDNLKAVNEYILNEL